MNTLIDHTGIIADQWLRFSGDAGELAPGSRVLLPVEEWVERTRVWREHAGTAGAIGVILEPTDDPARLIPWLDELALVAIDFPAFTDGRGFSIARLLSGRLAYTGSIRAQGEIIADQVPLLQRCGFTEFELPSEHQAQIALGLLASPLPAYQPAASSPRTIALPGERFDIAALAQLSARAELS